MNLQTVMKRLKAEGFRHFHYDEMGDQIIVNNRGEIARVDDKCWQVHSRLDYVYRDFTDDIDTLFQDMSGWTKRDPNEAD